MTWIGSLGIWTVNFMLVEAVGVFGVQFTWVGASLGRIEQVLVFLEELRARSFGTEN